MYIIWNHIRHIFSCIETDRTKIYEESDIKPNTQTSAQLSEFCRRVALVPSVTTRQKPQAEARACIPCVSLLLMCFKYLNTLCFASLDIFQVPTYPVFRWYRCVSCACARNVSLFRYISSTCMHASAPRFLGGVGHGWCCIWGGASFLDIYILYPIFCFYCCV